MKKQSITGDPVYNALQGRRKFIRQAALVLFLPAFPGRGIISLVPKPDSHGKEQKDSLWYRDSYIHTHASVTFSPDDVDFIGKQIEAVRPDAIQFHEDIPFWERTINRGKLSRKVDFKKVAIINHAGTWRPEYAHSDKYAYRINADGTFAGRWNKLHLCFNSPGVYEDIIPHYYRDLPKRLQPHQVWIDEAIITVNICYCKFCKELYTKEFNAAPPLQLTGNNWNEWEQWVGFHRKSFEKWMKSVYQAVKSAGPDILVTFNHSYLIEQPEDPPYFIRNLSADILKNPLELGINARYCGSGKYPFDLMPGLSNDTWAGVEPKEQDTLYTEISLIIAHGGRWNIGEFPTRFGVSKAQQEKGIHERPAGRYLELAEKGAAFARERQAFCQHTTSVPYAALLHSARTHYAHVINNTNSPEKENKLGITSDGTIEENPFGKVNSRIYWPDNFSIAEDMIGAYEALIEDHVQFDIINEQQLQRDLKQYKLLVLSEQSHLQQESIPLIDDFVRNGGYVIASGTTAFSGLDTLLGIEPVSTKPFDSCLLDIGGEELSVGQAWSVRAVKAESVQSFVNPSMPAILEHTHGKGKTVYIACDIFNAYYSRSGLSLKPGKDNGNIRKYIVSLFDRLPLEKMLSIQADPWIETLLRKKDNQLYLHLINRSGHWKQSMVSLSEGKVEIELLTGFTPENVLLQPGNEKIKYSFEHNLLKCTITPGQIGLHRILNIVG